MSNPSWCSWTWFHKSSNMLRWIEISKFYLISSLLLQPPTTASTTTTTSTKNNNNNNNNNNNSNKKNNNLMDIMGHDYIMCACKLCQTSISTNKSTDSFICPIVRRLGDCSEDILVNRGNTISTLQTSYSKLNDAEGREREIYIYKKLILIVSSTLLVNFFQICVP